MPRGTDNAGRPIRYSPKPPWTPPVPAQAAAPTAPELDAQEDARLLAKAALAQIKRLRAELQEAGLLASNEEET